MPSWQNRKIVTENGKTVITAIAFVFPPSELWRKKGATMGYRTEDEEGRRCLECGNEIVYGRADRKFCCELCKNRFNNRKNNYIRAMRARVLGAINRNYSILDGLIMNGVTAIPMIDLKQMGFDPDYVTSYSKVRRHDEFRCFDIRFRIVASEVVGISRVRPCGSGQ